MGTYMSIIVFNTWVNSENLGDKIIMNYCFSILETLFPFSLLHELPTHTKLNYRSYRLFSGSSIRFVCGTNLLKSKMNFRKLWDINFVEALLLRDIVLVGVGWQSYSGKPNLYTRILLRKILSKRYCHSVRDEYTKEKLEAIGIRNVILTGCPTLWNSDSIDISGKVKPDSVVFTVTSYNQDLKLDQTFIFMLIRNYKKVYFWPQSFADIQYLKELGFENEVILLSPCLSSFDELMDDEIDYVGTRLHAGIHAYNHGCRSFIIGIDNRALEMAPLGLKVYNRNQNDLLEIEIRQEYRVHLDIPKINIEKWKRQFSQQPILGIKNSFLLEKIIYVTKVIKKKKLSLNKN